LTRNHLIKIFIFKKILKKEKKKKLGWPKPPPMVVWGWFQTFSHPLSFMGVARAPRGLLGHPHRVHLQHFSFFFLFLFFLFSFLLHATSDHSSFFYFLVLYSFLSLSHSLSIHSDFVLQVLTDWQRGGAIGLWP
jgi:hypothetical protein